MRHSGATDPGGAGSPITSVFRVLTTRSPYHDDLIPART
jgi:hypothetical protein